MAPPTNLLLAAQQVEYPEQTEFQYWVAIAGLVAIAALLLITWYRSSYAVLDEANRRHKAAARQSWRQSETVTYRLPRYADLSNHRDGIRRAITAAMGENDAPERMTVLGALGAVRAAVTAPVRDRLPTIPRLAVLTAEIGVAVLVFGAMAVSTDTIVDLLGYQTAAGGEPLLEQARELTFTTLETGVDVLASFPGADLLQALTLATVIQAVSWAYSHYYITAPLLLLAATIVAVLGYWLDDVNPELYDTRWTLPLTILAAVAGVWFVGVTIAGLARLLNTPRLGAGIGFFAAVALATYFLITGVRNLYTRARSAALISTASHPALATGYIFVRKLAAILASLLTPFIPVYLAVIITTGRLSRMIHAVFDASLEVQLTIATTLLLTITWAVYVARTAWPDIRQAVAETTARRRVRVAILSRGIPYTGLVVGYIAAYSLTDSILLALPIATLTAVIAALLSAGVRRAQTQTHLWHSPDTHPETVLIEATALHDADDQTYPTVRLNGSHTLRFPDVDTAVEETIAAADTLAQGEDLEMTVWEWAAEELLEWGIPSFDDARSRAREACREAAVRLWEENQRSVTRDEFEEELAEYPASVRAALLEEWSGRGIVEARPNVLSLRRNPWSTPS